MSQRNDKEKKETITDKSVGHFRSLRKTKTIKHDLDKHLLMLDVIPTTHKSDLKKMVKK
jgi:hypothetical protein